MKTLTTIITTAILAVSGFNADMAAQAKKQVAQTPAIEKLSTDFTYTPKFEDFIIVVLYNEILKKDSEWMFKFVSKGELKNNTDTFFQDATIREQLALYDSSGKKIDVRLNTGIAGLDLHFGSLKPGETKMAEEDGYMYHDFKPEVLEYPVSKAVLEQYVFTKDLQGNSKRVSIARKDITEKWIQFIKNKKTGRIQIRYGKYSGYYRTEIKKFIDSYK